MKRLVCSFSKVVLALMASTTPSICWGQANSAAKAVPMVDKVDPKDDSNKDNSLKDDVKVGHIAQVPRGLKAELKRQASIGAFGSMDEDESIEPNALPTGASEVVAGASSNAANTMLGASQMTGQFTTSHPVVAVLNPGFNPGTMDGHSPTLNVENISGPQVPRGVTVVLQKLAPTSDAGTMDDNRPKSPVILSLALAKSGDNSIQLRFSAGLDLSKALDSQNYTIRVNGQQIAPTRIGFTNGGSIINIILPNGTIHKSDSIHVQWSNLLDMKGSLLEGEIGPFKA